MSPQDIISKSNISKLPCNSGLSLDRVETEKPTQQAIEALIELSHDSIDVIAWHLADILHMLTKVHFNTIELSFATNASTETDRDYGTSDHRSASVAVVHFEGAFCYPRFKMGHQDPWAIQ